MLRRLHISNYVLINSLDVDFPEGLSIITGQTGAGKSILLGALSLLLGGKGDSDVISGDADSCVVEGEFELPTSSELEGLVEELDIDWDGGNLLVRRVLNRSGRSRYFVNDCPVPVAVLSQLTPFLVNIHSQHSSLLLSDRRYQLSVLDDFAGNTALLERSSELWTVLRKLREELAAAKEKLSRSESESDYIAAQFHQLDAAGLKSGELEELEQEQRQLQNAELICGNLGRSSELLSGEGAEPSCGVDMALKNASRMLNQIAGFVPAVSDLSSRLDSSRVEISDILSEIDRLASSSVFSPSRLGEVESRLDLLYSLLGKHSCTSVDELIALRDKFAGGMSDSENLSDKIDALSRKVVDAQNSFDEVCLELRKRRSEAAPALASVISDKLKFLELDKAEFGIKVSACEPGPRGADSVFFEFSATGGTLADVSKCASGGELSRLMLSLKAALPGSVSTMVFDEIDTGVSGSVADKMGSMICALGQKMQVIAITHLPQVAAKGDAHYLVEKTFDESGTAKSSITKLSYDGRVAEIARMLSGASVTPQAVANARALLDAD